VGERQQCCGCHLNDPRLAAETSRVLTAATASAGVWQGTTAPIVSDKHPFIRHKRLVSTAAAVAVATMVAVAVAYGCGTCVVLPLRFYEI